MPAHTTTQTATGLYGVNRLCLVYELNGGSIEVQVPFDDDWLTIETIAEDGLPRVYDAGMAGSEMRFVPSGGAKYEYRTV